MVWKPLVRWDQISVVYLNMNTIVSKALDVLEKAFL